MDRCQLQAWAWFQAEGRSLSSSLGRQSCCLGTWCKVSLRSVGHLYLTSPPWGWPKDSQALQHEEQNGVYQVGAKLDGSVYGSPSDASGTVSFEDAEDKPCSVMNTIIYKLEVLGNETFIHWCWLSLPNAFSQEGSKSEFFWTCQNTSFSHFLEGNVLVWKWENASFSYSPCDSVQTSFFLNDGFFVV